MLDVFRFWTHIIMAYAITVWTCYVLQREYAKVAAMRLLFLASEKRRPDQFTVCETETLKFFCINYLQVSILDLVFKD